MKTQTHTPWIEGFKLIKNMEMRLAVQHLSKSTDIPYKNIVVRIKVQANNATYITDQFIIGMIRSAKRG